MRTPAFRLSFLCSLFGIFCFTPHSLLWFKTNPKSARFRVTVWTAIRPVNSRRLLFRTSHVRIPIGFSYELLSLFRRDTDLPSFVWITIMNGLGLAFSPGWLYLRSDNRNSESEHPCCFSSSLSIPLACYTLRCLSAIHICWPYRSSLAPRLMVLETLFLPHGIYL